MMDDKLEGTGLPAHGLVFLDVSLVLAMPLYLYVEPWVETWSKSLHKVGFTRKARVLLGLQGQTPGFPASGPWTPQNFLLHFPKTLWAFPFGPNNVFSYPNISGNIRNPFR